MISALLVIIAVILNTAAQFFLKAGAGQLSGLASTGGSILKIGWVGITNFWIAGGLACYIISFAVWIGVLARLPVSVAYPLLSLGYVIGLFASYWFFGESLGTEKLVGVGLILAGVYLLSKNMTG